MKKFEEEFDNLMRAFVDYRESFDFDTEKNYLELEKEFIEKYGKKQQPEIPEVPQFVADWYEENKGSLDYMIFETCRDLTDESTNEFENWFGYDENKAITTLVNMKNGYTVSKEKRFYLKHIEMSKSDEHNDYYIGKNPNGVLDHWGIKKGNLPRLAAILKLTKQEIDSMAADSYEQIEVEE